MATQQGQEIDITALSVQQLSQIKKQLDDELEHLTNSFTKLRAAQAKFRECLKTIRDGVSADMAGKPILVPLTNSLYVPGEIAETEKVIVDVGTGFYVEKTAKDAKKFYDARIDDLATNLKSLEGIVQGKSQNLRVVEDVLRQKVISAGNNGPPGPE